MSDVAIRVDGLGKRYRLGQRNNYKTLRNALVETASASLQRVSSLLPARSPNGRKEKPGGDQLIWALRDVSFEIGRGQVVGIIGRNGSGKSTLLKILSRITDPTEGCAEVHGRIGSLLEVGTGFNPELTGRENVYMNGIFLGMSKAEVDRKFDEIVAFSEMEKFLDTPVKRYSSGMTVRLAFAVAAHLEPEILLIDEVLAVGDAMFQQKCLGKMGRVAREGRTILFVSHNMAAVQSLCGRVIWLDSGRVLDQGRSDEVVSRYLQAAVSTLTEHVWDDPATAPGNDQLRLHRASVQPSAGAATDPITIRTPFVLEFEYWNMRPDSHLSLNLHLYNEQGILVFSSMSSREPVGRVKPSPVGRFRASCCVPGDLLNEGIHRVELHFIENQRTVIYRHEDILTFQVHDAVEMRGAWYGKWPGVVHPNLEWTTEERAQ